MLWQRPTEGPLKAWPSACRHNPGHNPPLLINEAPPVGGRCSANSCTGADQRSIYCSILCPAVASGRCLQKVQDSSKLQHEPFSHSSSSFSQQFRVIFDWHFSSVASCHPFYAFLSCGNESHNCTTNWVEKHFILFVMNLLLNKVK